MKDMTEASIEELILEVKKRLNVISIAECTDIPFKDRIFAITLKVDAGSDFSGVGTIHDLVLECPSYHLVMTKVVMNNPGDLDIGEANYEYEEDSDGDTYTAYMLRLS